MLLSGYPQKKNAVDKNCQQE